MPRRGGPSLHATIMKEVRDTSRMKPRAPVCTDEDLDMAIDYLFRYESDDPEDNVAGVHRVAQMLDRMLKARWTRQGRRKRKS